MPRNVIDVYFYPLKRYENTENIVLHRNLGEKSVG